MRVFKVILAFVILLGAAEEYVRASHQLGKPFYGPIVFMVVLVIVLCTWLIRSGFSKEKFILKSFRTLAFFVLTSILFVLITVVKQGAYNVPADIVEVNGINIPIGDCIDGSINLIPDLNERKQYCRCHAEKLSASQEVLKDYKPDLEAGKLAKVFAAIQSKPLAAELGVQSCFGGADVQWTDNVVKSMKDNCRAQLKGTSFEQTNDVEKFCNCLADEYQKFPPGEITKEDFRNSVVNARIDSTCIQASAH